MGCQASAVQNGGDFIQRLDQFCNQPNNIKAGTYLVTLEIPELYSQVSHQSLIMTLNDFLHTQTVNGRFDRLTVTALVELTHIVLRNNLFVYQQKIYRYMQGCPKNLSLIELLGSIYIHRWSMKLIRQIRLTNEFYARYHNTVFFTWSESKSKLDQLLKKVTFTLPSDLQTKISIGNKVHFLNAYIENQNGHLHTRVYHNPSKQLFLLPYASEHPRLTHRQWYRYALVRAVQYCATLEDFHEERQQIELSFLANGYSLDFVEYHLRQFFKRFAHVYQSNVSMDQNRYMKIRQEIFRFVQQQKDAYREQQQWIQNRRLLSFYYLFDWGTRHIFNAQFYQLWNEIIGEDPNFKAQGYKVILKSKHCYSSYTLLAQRFIHNI